MSRLPSYPDNASSASQSTPISRNGAEASHPHGTSINSGDESVIAEPLSHDTPPRSTPLRRNRGSLVSPPQTHHTDRPYYTRNHITRSPTPPFKQGTPSDSYFSQSIIPSNRLASPSQKLLVLDLNGTLVFRPPPKPSKMQREILPRPYMLAFAQFIARHPTIQTMIWSSAWLHNVMKMVDAAFGNGPEGKCRLIHIWARDTLGLSQAEFGQLLVYSWA